MYIKHEWTDGPRCSSEMLNHLEESVSLLSGLIDSFDSINTGNSDAVGPIGDKGATGNPGKQGPVGPDGDKGPDGAVGNQGAPGAKGATGPKGKTGAKGPVGDTGPTGANGKNFDISTSYSNLKTTAKTIDGSINELNILLGGVMYV